MEPEIYRKILDTCWFLAEQGLDSLTISKISEGSKVHEIELLSLFPEQKFILLALIADVREQVVLPPYTDTLSNNDPFFDAVMALYDRCQIHKGAIRRLSEDMPCHPLLFLSITPSLQHISNDLVDRYFAASPPSLITSVWNSGQKLAYQLLLLRVFHQWLEDDTFDMSQTMITLDQGLKHMAQLRDWCNPISEK
jgi:hypothetical protein